MSIMDVFAKRCNSIRQIDIISAFLYKFLHEKINIMQSTMFEDGTNKLCFLKKALYGLKKAIRVSCQTTLNFFRKLNFNKTEADHSLFVSADQIIFIAVHLEELLCFGAHIDPCIDNIMHKPQDRSQMTNLGNVSHYLDKKTIILRQSIYLKKILEKYKMSNYRPAQIHINPCLANSFIT